MRRIGVKGVEGIDFPKEPKRRRRDPDPRNDIDPDTRGESAEHERYTRLPRLPDA
jgi:hypothetical protein